jgi:hypothetical protein
MERLEETLLVKLMSTGPSLRLDDAEPDLDTRVSQPGGRRASQLADRRARRSRLPYGYTCTGYLPYENRLLVLVTLSVRSSGGDRSAMLDREKECLLASTVGNSKAQTDVHKSTFRLTLDEQVTTTRRLTVPYFTLSRRVSGRIGTRFLS